MQSTAASAEFQLPTLTAAGEPSRHFPANEPANALEQRGRPAGDPIMILGSLLFQAAQVASPGPFAVLWPSDQGVPGSLQSMPVATLVVASSLESNNRGRLPVDFDARSLRRLADFSNLVVFAAEEQEPELLGKWFDAIIRNASLGRTTTIVSLNQDVQELWQNFFIRPLSTSPPRPRRLTEPAQFLDVVVNEMAFRLPPIEGQAPQALQMAYGSEPCMGVGHLRSTDGLPALYFLIDAITGDDAREAVGPQSYEPHLLREILGRCSMAVLARDDRRCFPPAIINIVEEHIAAGGGARVLFLRLKSSAADAWLSSLRENAPSAVEIIDTADPIMALQ